LEVGVSSAKRASTVCAKAVGIVVAVRVVDRSPG
jgi:hypothetical protein